MQIFPLDQKVENTPSRCCIPLPSHVSCSIPSLLSLTSSHHTLENYQIDMFPSSTGCGAPIRDRMLRRIAMITLSKTGSQGEEADGSTKDHELQKWKKKKKNTQSQVNRWEPRVALQYGDWERCWTKRMVDGLQRWSSPLPPLYIDAVQLIKKVEFRMCNLLF